jgi:signal peptidase I
MTLFLFLVAASIIIQFALAFDAARRVARGMRRPPTPWFKSILLTVLCVLVIQVGMNRVCPPRWRSYSIPTSSNNPTLQVGDWMVAWLAPQDPSAVAGPMIVFYLPDRKAEYVKRVVGTQGDHV